MASGGVRTPRANWADVGGGREVSKAALWKAVPTPLRNSGGEVRDGSVASYFSFFSGLSPLYRSANHCHSRLTVREGDGGRRRRREKKSSPLGASDAQMLALPLADCPVGALETPPMGGSFPQQGDVTSRQVLTPSLRLHARPPEWACTQPRDRALPAALLKAPYRTQGRWRDKSCFKKPSFQCNFQSQASAW